LTHLGDVRDVVGKAVNFLIGSGARFPLLPICVCVGYHTLQSPDCLVEGDEASGLPALPVRSC